MQTIRKQLVEEIRVLSDAELQQVAEYIAFLKRRPVAYQPELSDEAIGALYREYAEEERSLAEEGMEDYLNGIQAEENL